MLKGFSLFYIAILVSMLTGCAGGTSMFRENPEHSGVANSSAPRELDKLVWKYSAPSKVYSSPIVSDGTVYIGCKDGSVYALDLYDGHLKWSFATKDNVEASVAVQGDTLYIGSWDGYLYAVDIDSHELKWKFRTDGLIYSAPVIEGGVVYFGSKDKHVYAVDADTGAEVWRFDAQAVVSVLMCIA